MKKGILHVAIILLIHSVTYSRTEANVKVTTKTGWLVYWAGHKIWIEANLSKKIKPTSFFKDSLYKNALRMPSHYKADFLGKFAHLYVVTHQPESTRHSRDVDSIWILPVKAEVKERPTGHDEAQTVTFYHKDRKIEIEYHFETNYTIENVEALTKKDQARINRYLRKRGWTVEDALRQQKGAF